MITKYISELLFDHECVIIPEFGAFISKEVPATIDYVNHRLTPPSKELAFNRQLLSDDGLLVDYVAKRKNITRNEASKLVHDFALSSLAVVETSGVLRLDGIGILSRVTDKDFVFQLDENLNLFGDAFGLTSFTVQPIYRRETYKHIAEKITIEQKERNTPMTVHEEEKVLKPHRVNRRNYKWFRAAAYSMMIATVLVILGWGANKSDSNFASWNPLFYSSPNEFIAMHFNNKIEAREIITVEKLTALRAQLPTTDNDVKYIQPVDAEQLKPVDINQYYIIGASLKTEKEAQRCVKSFQNQGFSNAVSLPMNDKGNVRVAYDLVMGKDAAIKKLEIIKKEYNEAAWLLRKK
ncbi:MAG: hypothetical protein IKS65_10785 [Bacteroidales bacterium]|nr:hypothetical protein [Bacteroidales bacterium]